MLCSSTQAGSHDETRDDLQLLKGFVISEFEMVSVLVLSKQGLCCHYWNGVSHRTTIIMWACT